MKLYGIIGNPLGHSFSKGYFTRKFESEGIADSRYENFQIDRIEDVEAVVNGNPDLAGFNVTIPYKQQIFRYLDEVDPRAEEIGAVNCVKVIRPAGGGRPLLKGYNTDADGFRGALTNMLGQARPRALVLGTGGASKAVCYVLKSMGMDFRLVSRSGEGEVLSYSDLDRDMIDSYKLIINTTPLGTFPKTGEAADIPYDGIGPGHFLFDLVYNPPITRFMHEGQIRGAVVQNGYAMLVGQAEKAWALIND